MEIFISILFKIIPLYIFVVIGYIAGKYLGIDAKGIGKLIIYIIAPFVIFEAITHSNLSISTFLLPIIAFLICSLVAFLFLLCNLLVWPLALYAMVYSVTELLLLLAVKFFADVIILTFASFNFKDYSLIKYSLPMFIFYPIILLVVLFFNAVNYDLKWKKRTVVKR